MARNIMDISRVDTRDYIRLVANYLCLMRGDKDNEAELLSRGYTLEQINAANVRKSLSHVELMGLKFTVPLTRFKYPLLGYVLKITENYERGVLPFPGSLTEQPAQIMEIIDTLHAVKFEFTNSTQKKSHTNGRHDSNKPRTR